MRDRLLMTPSVTPSAIYSRLGSPEVFAKGSTAIDWIWLDPSPLHTRLRQLRGLKAMNVANKISAAAAAMAAGWSHCGRGRIADMDAGTPTDSLSRLTRFKSA